MRYVVYITNSGEITKNIVCPESTIQLQLTSEENYIQNIDVVDDTKFYIVNETVTPRPTFSESVSGTTISNLPIPTTVRTNNSSYTITDGSAELSFSLPGNYKVYLSSFPYQDKVVEVIQV